MHITLHWKRNLLGSTYSIYDNKILMGQLKKKGWTRSGIGILNGKEYLFKRKGFFSSEVEVIDGQDDTKIGEINFRMLKTRATFEYLGEVFQWKYTNIWNTKWEFMKGNRVCLTSQGATGKGTLDMKVKDDLLVLAGLYISNYFREVSGAGA